MAYPCTDDPQEVLASIDDVVANSAKLDSFVNGEDTDTVQLGAGDPTPALRNVVRQMLDIAQEAVEYSEEVPGYIRIYCDSERRFLWGIREDGSIEWAKGVPIPVRDYVDARVPYEASAPVAAAVEDSAGRILSSTKMDGTAVFPADVEVKGRLVCESLPKTADWSDAPELQIPEPRCAKVNIIGLHTIPNIKGIKVNCQMEFWDMQGNYFKKRIVAEAQGRSSLTHPKRNLTVDLKNEDGKKFYLRIGDWVVQDSFHLKAYWNEPLRCANPVCCDLYNDMLLTRGPLEDRPWKKALVKQDGPYTRMFGGEDSFDRLFDTGARCVPAGFPFILYFDGSFYGVYSWQLKKDKDNYHLKKSDDKGKQVYVEGTTTANSLLASPVLQWNLFEIRYPKDLVTMDGGEYDNDTPEELIDPSKDYDPDSSKNYNPNNKDHVRSYNTKQTILLFNSNVRALSALEEACIASPTAENVEAVKTAFEKLFDVDNVIDYTVLDEVEGQNDSYGNNTQWLTWDGKKWFILPYDMDISFGWKWRNPAPTAVPNPSFVFGGYCGPVWTDHKELPNCYPGYYVYKYYLDELNARWAFLRNSGIIDADYIAGKILSWQARVGFDNLEADHQRWSANNYGMGDTAVNEGFWELAENSPSGTESTFSLDTAYAVGDTVYYGLSEGSGYFLFTCVKACTGVAPVAKVNFHESVFRTRNWIAAQIASMDQLYGYNS